MQNNADSLHMAIVARQYGSEQTGSTLEVDRKWTGNILTVGHDLTD